MCDYEAPGGRFVASALIALLLLLGVVRAPAARAADAATDVAETEEAATQEEGEVPTVEVVATPIVEPTVTTRYGTQVSTVSESQMEALDARDLPSALRRVPGVTISRYNHVGSYGGREGGAVIIRGMGGARPGADILTMVDGIPKVVGVWTHPLMDVLSIDNAERIDVYKSPQPVFHGNMGFAAVDLVPKRRTEPGFETRLSGAYGAHHTVLETIEHGGKVGPWDYYVLQSYKRSRGHRPHSAGQVEDYFVRLGRELSDVWDLSYTFVHTDSWAEDPGPEGGPVPERDRFGIRDDMHVLTLSNHSGATDGHVKFYWDSGHIDWPQFDVEPFNSVTDYDNYGLKAQQTVYPWEGGEVILGFDYDVIGGTFVEERPSGNLYEGSKKSFHLVSPYAMVSHLFGEEEGWHFIPSAGARFTDHDEFEDGWGPQAGVVLGKGESELHANYAHGFNYPGVYAVFQTESAWHAGEAWQQLEPEELDHYEVGLAHRVCPWLKAQAVAFWNDGENRIQFVAPPPPPPVFQNIGDFKTEGVEVTLDVNPASNWSAFVGATFLTEIEPEELPYAPEDSLSFGASYRPWERWRFDLDGQYVSDVFTTNPRFPGAQVEVDDYWLFNGKVTHTLTQRDDKVQAKVFMAVENIFDESYEYRAGYPMPGTTLTAGFEVRF